MTVLMDSEAFSDMLHGHSEHAGLEWTPAVLLQRSTLRLRPDATSGRCFRSCPPVASVDGVSPRSRSKGLRFVAQLRVGAAGQHPPDRTYIPTPRAGATSVSDRSSHGASLAGPTPRHGREPWTSQTGGRDGRAKRLVPAGCPQSATTRSVSSVPAGRRHGTAR